DCFLGCPMSWHHFGRLNMERQPATEHAMCFLSTQITAFSLLSGRNFVGPPFQVLLCVCSLGTVFWGARRAGTTLGGRTWNGNRLRNRQGAFKHSKYCILI